MERGKIDIHFSESSQELSVHIRLSEDGTVWLTQHEIADLFDVYIQTVRAGLKVLFQRGVLFETEVMRTHRFINVKGRECSLELYNLDAVIALGFYMKGGICRLFRKWMYKRIKEPKYNSTALRSFIIQLSPDSTRH